MVKLKRIEHHDLLNAIQGDKGLKRLDNNL